MIITKAFRKELAKRADELQKSVIVNSDNTIDFTAIETQKAFKKALLESFKDSGMIIEDMIFGMAWKIK